MQWPAAANFRGIAADFRRRRPWYWSDFTEGLGNAKTTASIVYMFFTSIAPAITFAELLEDETEAIGVVEVCLSSCLSGMIFSLFAGQPLCIVGVTGPVSILTISIFGLSKQLGIRFLPFYAWSQIFAALMHMAIAALGLCEYIKYITNFSCHTFGLLIALIYLVTGARGVAAYFFRDLNFGEQLGHLVIALGTAGCSMFLARAHRWTILNRFARQLISDYAPTASILVWTVISKLGKFEHNVDRLSVPSTFRTVNGRAWFASNLFELPPWAIALALVPGAIITVLFIFDHNVSSILAQQFPLRKGSAYHLDFFVLGGCILTTGLLGIPPCNGLIPQAPLHTKSLCVFKKGVSNGVEVEVVERCYEQRYTNFFQALLTGVVCFKPFLAVLGFVPRACLHGLFIFMALSSLPGNELWDRFVLLVSEPALRVSRHDFFKLVDFSTIAKFTRYQLVAVVVIYGVTLTPLSMTFPLFIAALVYVRTNLLPKRFHLADLLVLDPLIDLGDEVAASPTVAKPPVAAPDPEAALVPTRDIADETDDAPIVTQVG
mmetsp:Transcript_2764/g.8711  ORF Transcript_2764/g.8711 Transcript_2764/m.8711 type:complete len:547 (-) Transcript_2764:241-1881(-)